MGGGGHSFLCEVLNRLVLDEVLYTVLDVVLTNACSTCSSYILKPSVECKLLLPSPVFLASSMKRTRIRTEIRKLP